MLAGHPPHIIAEVNRICATEGWQMIAAATFEDIFASVDEGCASVIVLPSSLDGLLPHDQCACIRARPLQQYVPLVGFLSMATPADHAEALLSGFDVYLTYDHGMEALHRQLRDLQLALAVTDYKIDVYGGTATP